MYDKHNTIRGHGGKKAVLDTLEKVAPQQNGMPTWQDMGDRVVNYFINKRCVSMYACMFEYDVHNLVLLFTLSIPTAMFITFLIV